MADGWGAALQAGVDGYMRGANFTRQSTAADEEDQWRKEQREAARADVADKSALRADLKNAAAPVAVDEGMGGMVRPPEMDNRDVGLPENANLTNGGLMPMAYRVGTRAFGDRAAADAAAAEQNSPRAVAERQAQVYAQRGMPLEAATLGSRQAELLQKAAEFRKAGVFDSLQAFRAGNKEAAVKGLRASGLFDVADGDVTINPKEIELPGIGKVNTYDLTFNQKMADGKIEPATINSHAASLAMMPLEQQLELQRKGVETANKAMGQRAAVPAFSQAPVMAASGTGRQGAVAGQGLQGTDTGAGPSRVSSRAERDGLPAGASYIAPDGQTYIKR